MINLLQKNAHRISTITTTCIYIGTLCLMFLEVGMCTSDTVAGETVTILSGSVPARPTNCYCDVSVNSPTNISLYYDGPDINGCYMEVHLIDAFIGCFDTELTRRIKSPLRLTLMTFNFYQPPWCIYVKPISGNRLEYNFKF